jgi:hypothetical protein
MTSDSLSQGFQPRPDAIPKHGGLSNRIPGQAVIEKLLADRQDKPSVR